MEQKTGYKLSRQQQRICLLQKEFGQKMFSKCVIAIQGPVNSDEIKQTLQQIVARHENLYTSCSNIPGHDGLLQVLNDAKLLGWNIVKGEQYTTISSSDAIISSSEAVNSAHVNEAMLDATLVEIDASNYRLIISAPSLQMDHKSWINIFHELCQLLRNESIDEEVQYIDYSSWQEDTILSSPEGLAYWQQKKPDAWSETRLPGEVTAATEINLSSFSREIPLKDIEHMTINADNLLAAWLLLLYRLNNQDELVINHSFDGRISNEFSGAVGAYSTITPLCVHLASDMDFDEVMKCIKLQLTDNENYHFFVNWEKFMLQRRSVGFEFVGLPQAECVEKTILDLQSIVVHNDALKIKLTGVLKPENDCLQLYFDYDSKMFTEFQIKDFAESLQCLLRQLRPSTKTSELEIISPKQRQRLLKDFNNTSHDYNYSCCLHQKIEAQVAKTPDAIAIEFGEQQLSYLTLNEKANQLAHTLHTEGIKAGDYVGVCMDRSPLLLIALLGVMKAGGTYIPIDSAIPAERIRTMLGGVSTMVTNKQVAQDLTFLDEVCDCIYLDESDKVLTVNTGNPDVEIDNKQAAYVLYTSGSTGKPKGVAISHRSLINYLEWANDTYTHEGKWAVFHTSISFDLTITSVFTPLVSGGKVIILDQSSGLEDLQETLIKQFEPGILKITPAHLKGITPWLTTLAVDQLKLESLIIGGEALYADELAVCFEKVPHLQIYNEYGPTEATVGCCVYKIKSNIAGRVPIGTPIYNTCLYVLDNNRNIIPPGCIGELYIGGDGLAQGYINDAGITNQSFIFKVIDPEQREQRLYKTGDLVRFIQGDTLELEFVGRNDRQVKIRGYRIELDEIEIVLKQQEDIADAVVLSHKNQLGDNQLTAYMLSSNNKTTVQYQAELADSLPEYMIPAKFSVMENFPLTRNGKIDYEQLAKINSSGWNSETTVVLPGTPMEKRLAEIWKKALALDLVGIHDNFFELGGDSLRSVHVAAMAKSAGLDLDVQDLFKTPTIFEIAKTVKELDHNQKDQVNSEFSLLSSEDRKKIEDIDRDFDDVFPLGAVQLGMLFHMLQDSTSIGPPDYHNVATFRFRLLRPFDRKLFQKSVDKVVAHTPNMRTSFDMTSYSEPLQFVHKKVDLPVGYEDLRDYPSENQERLLKEFIQQENFNLVDVSKASMMRFFIHQLKDNIICLSFTEPHSIGDGWSSHLTLIDVFTVYFSYQEGKEASLPPMKSSYSDFIRAERETIHSQRAIDFWDRKLQDCVLTELPKYQNSNESESLEIGDHRQPMSVPRDVVEGLYRLVAEAGVPIKACLLAAHFKLLSLISGQEKVTTGLNYNGRLEKEDGTRVRGLFLNMLPVTMELSGGSWLELVKQAHEAELELIPYRRFPLSILQRKYGHRNLFDTALSFLHFHSIATSPGLDGGRIEHLGTVDHSKTNYDFNPVFHLDPSDKYNMIYLGDANLNRFSAEQISSFLSILDRILRDLAFNFTEDYNRLDFLSDEDRRTSLIDYNKTTADYPKEKTVIELFSEQVHRQPKAVALEFRDEKTISYAELDSLSNQLAHRLIATGVQQEEIVGLYFDCSKEMIIAILSVLKAGCAYLPLDTDYPHERLNHIITEAKVKRVLCQQLPDNPFAADTQCIQVDAALLHGAETTQPVISTKSTHLAYVLYTSGSTGRPKGVMVTHQGLTNYVCWADRTYIRGEPVCFPLFTSLSFDLTVTSIFSPLISGNQIRLYPEDSPIALLEQIISDNRVDIVKMTPAHLALLQGMDISQWQAKRLIIGGEQLQVGLVRWITANSPVKIEIYNEYGPTETVVGCTVHQFNPQQDLEGAVPIGKPADNVRIYILNNRRQIVPQGVKGEIYIAGDGVAKGYMGQAEKTADSFLDDPFHCGKMYRSGDLGRWHGNGYLEYLGRIDSQVKIRGYRIELEEIESRILHSGLISEAVVNIYGADEDKRLVAYYVSTDKETPAIELTKALKTLLAEQLPAYMVPAAYMQLEALPLTANGKLDRSALPLPDDTAVVKQQYIAPRNPIEQHLCVLWQDALKLDQVGIADNFLELGGHSILALQLIANIQNEFDKSLTINQFFTTPTIAELAQYISQEENTNNMQPLPKIVADYENIHQPFPLTNVQQAYLMGRSSIFELGNVASHIYIELNWYDLDVKKLNRAWNILVQRHEMLRTVFTLDAMQRILKEPVHYDIKYRDISDVEEAAANNILTVIRNEMSHQVFAAETWPLFDIRTIKLSDKKFRLYFSMDALLSDAMSFDILGYELNKLYQDNSIRLDNIDISFRDYILAEAHIRNTDRYENSRSYWSNRLESLPSAPELFLVKHPADIERPSFTRRGFTLPAHQWDVIQSKAKRAGVTASTYVLTAFSFILGKWSRHKEFTLNLTLFNRLPLHEHVNRLIGDFTSLTLLEINLQGQLSFNENAKHIQERLWQDLEHRYFSGVEVLRSLNSRHGEVQAVTMPIVFSSTIGMAVDELTDEDVITGIEQEYSISQTPQVWLDHQLSDNDGDLKLSWDAIDELFPAAMLDDMFTAYCDLIQALAHHEEQDILTNFTELPNYQLLKRSEVNSEVNATHMDYEVPPESSLLHGMFRQQVKFFAHKDAVVSGTTRLSYAELDARALALAYKLLEEGVQPNELVAVVMEKGWQQIVAVLGVLYAGAAYLPIDAGLPRERIKLLVKEGEARVVLIQNQLLDSINYIPEVCFMDVDNIIADYSRAYTDLHVNYNTENLAYVIFTSGSTGLPKGVMIDHRGAVNTIIDINKRFNLTAADRVLAVSALNFDLSVYDVFGLLAVGGCIVMPSAHQEKDPKHWLELIAKENITVWNTVPALAQLLIEEMELQSQAEHLSLKTMLLSGDWIPLELPSRVKHFFPEIQLISLGGATEVSIWSIHYPIHVVESDWRSIPYGKPLANQSFYVLDEALNNRPDWVGGDLYIGGKGLAKGYWKDEIKTKASFIQHPHTGERLYKTGDLGYYRPDGNIIFLGREDTQVKIHGHRIELGEIESTIIRHDGIKDATVILLGQTNNQQRLIAYIVPTLKSETNFSDALERDIEEFKEYLVENLPDYMIPVLFIPLERIPLTENGKVNRKALPLPEDVDMGETTYVAPANEVEQTICEYCQELLGLEKVGTKHNIFEIGGDSLVITRLMSQIRQELGVEIPLRNIFENPTVIFLADYVIEARKKGTFVDIPELKPLSQPESLIEDEELEEGIL